MTGPSDPHEALGRLRKAIRLADGLAALGYTDLSLDEITPTHLEWVSRHAGVVSASADTWDVVQALLADRRLTYVYFYERKEGRLN